MGAHSSCAFRGLAVVPTLSRRPCPSELLFGRRNAAMTGWRMRWDEALLLLDELSTAPHTPMCVVEAATSEAVECVLNDKPLQWPAIVATLRPFHQPLPPERCSELFTPSQEASGRKLGLLSARSMREAHRMVLRGALGLDGGGAAAGEMCGLTSAELLHLLHGVSMASAQDAALALRIIALVPFLRNLAAVPAECSVTVQAQELRMGVGRFVARAKALLSPPVPPEEQSRGRVTTRFGSPPPTSLSSVQQPLPVVVDDGPRVSWTAALAAATRAAFHETPWRVALSVATAMSGAAAAPGGPSPLQCLDVALLMVGARQWAAAARLVGALGFDPMPLAAHVQADGGDGATLHVGDTSLREECQELEEALRKCAEHVAEPIPVLQACKVVAEIRRCAGTTRLAYRSSLQSAALVLRAEQSGVPQPPTLSWLREQIRFPFCVGDAHLTALLMGAAMSTTARQWGQLAAAHGISMRQSLNVRSTSHADGRGNHLQQRLPGLLPDDVDALLVAAMRWRGKECDALSQQLRSACPGYDITAKPDRVAAFTSLSFRTHRGSGIDVLWEVARWAASGRLPHCIDGEFNSQWELAGAVLAGIASPLQMPIDTVLRLSRQAPSAALVTLPTTAILTVVLALTASASSEDLSLAATLIRQLPLKQPLSWGAAALFVAVCTRLRCDERVRAAAQHLCTSTRFNALWSFRKELLRGRHRVEVATRRALKMRTDPSECRAFHDIAALTCASPETDLTAKAKITPGIILVDAIADALGWAAALCCVSETPAMCFAKELEHVLSLAPASAVLNAGDAIAELSARGHFSLAIALAHKRKVARTASLRHPRSPR